MQVLDAKTKWNVLIGGPSSGKTTTIERLSELGFSTVPESARMHIDGQLKIGKTLEEIKSNPAEFQADIFALKLRAELTTDPNKLHFFDRAIPDSLAYHAFNGIEAPKYIVDACHTRYQNIFLLEQVGFMQDYARTETPEEALRLQHAAADAYTSIGYEPIVVPSDSVDNRVKFILDVVMASNGRIDT